MDVAGYFQKHWWRHMNISVLYFIDNVIMDAEATA